MAAQGLEPGPHSYIEDRGIHDSIPSTLWGAGVGAGAVAGSVHAAERGGLLVAELVVAGFGDLVKQVQLRQRWGDA